MLALFLSIAFAPESLNITTGFPSEIKSSFPELEKELCEIPKRVLVPPNVSLETDSFGSLGSKNYWSLADLSYDDGNLYWAISFINPEYNYIFRNNSTNASFIPQSSYYMYDMYLDTTVSSSPLTITAA